jgi:hypothetical protein
MEKQIILEEIKRISEIMNIKTKINLIEQEQELVKFLDGGSKVGAKSMDDFINKLANSGVKEADLIANSFKDLITKDILSQTEREFASNVIRDVFPKLIETNIIDFLDKLPKDGSDKLIKFFKSSKTLQEKVVGLKKLGYKNANELTAQVWTDVVNDRPIVIHIPTPTPHVEPHVTPIIDKSFDELFDNLINVTTAEEGAGYIKNFIQNEVDKGNLTLTKTTIDEVVNDIIKSLNSKMQLLTLDIERMFEGKPIAEQRQVANTIIKKLESSIPDEIKSKPWFTEWYSKWGNKVRVVGKTKAPYIAAAKQFAMFLGGLYIVGFASTLMYEFQKDDDGDTAMVKLKKSFKWMNTLFHYAMDDEGSTPTPSGQYTDTLDSFKQFLRDKNNQNADSATYDSNTGIYYVNGVDYEFDSTTKTFK